MVRGLQFSTDESSLIRYSSQALQTIKEREIDRQTDREYRRRVRVERERGRRTDRERVRERDRERESDTTI